jgi:hypothetical protein
MTVEMTPETGDRVRRKPPASRATLREKLGRSRTTNRPGHLALPTPLRQSRRRNDLIRMFIEALPDVTDLALVAVKRAAELTCAAERARALILTSPSVLATDLEMLSRLEGAAARAVRALGIKDAGAKPHVPLREQLAAEIEAEESAE